MLDEKVAQNEQPDGKFKFTFQLPTKSKGIFYLNKEFWKKVKKHLFKSLSKK